ncbi:MAG TPA: hypothetical protein VKZ89_11765 [Thermobifida alba]|nr:hypothetical protein [Thermobifida alba]
MATREAPKNLSKRGVWREYADGSWWRLERGIDWTGPTAQSRAQTAAYWAASNGYRLERRTEGPDVLYVKFTRKTGE